MVQEAAPAYQTSPRAFDNNAGRLYDSPDHPCALPNLNVFYRCRGPDLRSLKGVSFPSGENGSESTGGSYDLFERLAYLIYEGSAAEPRRFLESDMA